MVYITVHQKTVFYFFRHHRGMLLFCTALLAVLGTPGSPIRPDYRYANPKAVDKWHGKREIKNSNVYGWHLRMVNFFPLTFLWIALMHAVCMGQWTDVDMKFGLRIHWWEYPYTYVHMLCQRTLVITLYIIFVDYAKFGNVCTISRGEYAIGPEGPESWPLNRNAHNQTYLKW